MPGSENESNPGLRVGVLSLQGDFAAHSRMLTRIGVEPVEVRRAADFEALDALIIPGGESTTMLKFLTEERLARPVEEMARSGLPILGTCAGAILLARNVTNPSQASLGLVDIDIVRNAYGRQVDSFIGSAEWIAGGEPIEAVFIRAPIIDRTGPRVEILARTANSPVLVREGNIFVATFHPELTGDERVHRLVVSAIDRLNNEPVLVGESV